MNKSKLKAVAAKVLERHILLGGECFHDLHIHGETHGEWWPNEKEELEIDKYCQDILKPFLQRLRTLAYRHDEELNELLSVSDYEPTPNERTE